MFLANRIILGKMSFGQVPESLKPEVKQVLVENGCDFLVTE